MLTKSLNGKTPFELWHSHAQDYSYMWEIGCRAFVLIQNQHDPKINACRIECILVRYAQNSKAYRCYNSRTNKVYKSYYVQFIERHDELPNTARIDVAPTNTPVPTNASTPATKSTPTDASKPALITAIRDTSTDCPFITDDNNNNTLVSMLDLAPNNNLALPEKAPGPAIPLGLAILR